MARASLSPPSPLPSLYGVIHLRALPGSPGYAGDIAAVAASCARDASALADAGFEAVIVENYGDAPFLPGKVPPITVAAMTRCCLAARVAAPTLALGVNVLRNDAEAALAVAVAASASFIRINVHIGARLTDQGVIEGRAHETLRLRRALGAEHVRLLCDVDVKHSAPLAPRPLAEEANDLVLRGGADAVLVTGAGTGKGVAFSDLDEVARAVEAPVLVASGATIATLSSLRRAHGVIVGSALRANGKAGGSIDLELARRFAEAYSLERRTSE
jgi:membrane complex biogenesis BtpA family protein